MRAPSRLPAFRARAESLMTDACTITAPSAGSRGTLNQTTGKYDAAPNPVTVYEGRCRLGRSEAPNMSQAAGGEATWDVTDSVLHLPVDGSEAVVAGCTVLYESSEANPALVGRKFGVLSIVGGTYVTARRCLVREVVAS